MNIPQCIYFSVIKHLLHLFSVTNKASVSILMSPTMSKSLRHIALGEGWLGCREYSSSVSSDVAKLLSKMGMPVMRTTISYSLPCWGLSDF